MTPAALLALMLNVTTPLMPGVMVCPLEIPIPYVCLVWVRMEAAAHQKI